MGKAQREKPRWILYVPGEKCCFAGIEQPFRGCVRCAGKNIHCELYVSDNAFGDYGDWILSENGIDTVR